MLTKGLKIDAFELQCQDHILRHISNSASDNYNFSATTKIQTRNGPLSFGDTSKLEEVDVVQDKRGPELLKIT